MNRLHADPEFAARRDERMKRLNAEGRAGRYARVPKWVPRDLRSEYAQVMREQDEFAAAAHVRHLMREMTA